VIVLGCLAVWFCLFLGTSENNLLQREKHNWASKAHHKGAIGILTPTT
jgi:hypothetical protein